MFQEIELEYPYIGFANLYNGVVYFSATSFIPYDHYLYDVKEGKQHSRAEYENFINPEPKTILNYQRSFFFGMFSVGIVTVDTKDKNAPFRYKNSIQFRFLMYKYYIQIYSENYGLFNLEPSN